MLHSHSLSVPAVLALLAGSPNIFIVNDANTIEALTGRLIELNDRAQEIQAKAKAEADRNFTDDESNELDAIFASVEKTTAEIGRRERIANIAVDLGTPRGRQSEPVAAIPGDGEHVAPVAAAGAPRRTVPATVIVDSGKRGFRNIGDFAMSVARAGKPGGSVDPRLIQNSPTTWGSEGVGADGGFDVPPDFRTNIQSLLMGEDSLLPMCDLIETTSNTLTIPKDENAPWDTTNGIQATWDGEATQANQSKLQLGENTIKLHKLRALVPVTSELLDDAAALGSYINKKAPEKLNFKVNLALVQGTGVGQPLGFLNAPGTISVAKESGQASSTLLFQNIVKMYGRMYAPYRNGAVWLVSQDIEQQIMQMAFPVTTSGAQIPMFIPAGGMSNSPYATLMGRSMISTQAMNALGSQGDIALVNMKQYMAAQKVGGIRSDISIHLFFDYDMTAFRFILRLAGQPWRSTPVSPRAAGGATLSDFVVLDAR
ncbi:MAG: phage major capsid protein [Pseudomonadota bacterium]